MSLQVEVPVAGLADSVVDDGARLRVGGVFGFTIGCRVEAGVVALSNDDDGYAGRPLFVSEAG